MDTIESLAASFSRDLRTERLSPRSIELYRRAIHQFCQWLSNGSSETPIEQLTRENLKHWISDMTDRLAPATIRARSSAIRRFGSWLVEEDYLESNPALRLPVPDEVPESPDVLTDEQLSALLANCRGKDFLSRRDTAIFRVLIDTGVRVSELAGMTISGTDLQTEKTSVLGKGNKARQIYFSSKTTQALDRYIRVRSRHIYSHLDNLWVSQRGNLTDQGVRLLVKRHGKQVGIDDLHPHLFRHTWAHDHLLNETSAIDLKHLAGWTSDAMLRVYGYSGADVRAAAAAKRASRGDRV